MNDGADPRSPPSELLSEGEDFKGSVISFAHEDVDGRSKFENEFEHEGLL
jgi:hypothetical protein